jgi:putative membrane protein insertion efficiency factor
VTLRRILGALVAAIDFVLIGLIRGYQYALSPMLGQRCKYYPSCSNYAIGAIREHGPIKGIGLASWRLLRCNPFSNGGYDPVPTRRPHDCGHDHAGRNVSARV